MESLKTITFEDGKQYAVNAPAYEVSGELAEESNVIDFGVLPAELREITVITKGASGGSGDYYHLVFNGTETAFITGGDIYTDYAKHKFTKVGNMWVAEGGFGNAASYASYALNALDELTTFAIKGYDATKFPAGTRYALEGR